MVRLVRAALLAIVLAPSSAQGQDFAHSFRMDKLNQDIFRYHGAGAEKFVTPEAEGLRIRYDGANAPLNPVGVDRPVPLRGDFTVTVRYEVLKAEPGKGGGVGPELYLVLDNPHRDGIALDQRVRPSGERALSYNHLTNNEEGKRVGAAYKSTPTTEASDTGRLRLARQGRTLIASWAEGKDEEFKELTRDDIGLMNIRLIRLGGASGRDRNANLDLRFLEFHLRGGEAVAAAQEDANAPAPDGQPRMRWTIVAAIGIFFFVTLAAAIVVALIMLRRRPLAAQTTPEQKAGPQTIAFACPSCGKMLKVNHALASKRVKCPGCEEKVSVPTSEAAGSVDSSLKPSP